MGKRELVALLSLSSWCLVIVVWLFLAVPWVCLRFVIVVFSDHTHLQFLMLSKKNPLFMRGWIEKSDPRITVWHYEAYRVRTNGDSRVGFSYLTRTLMIDSYIIAQLCIVCFGYPAKL